jgi:hypothetical protein
LIASLIFNVRQRDHSRLKSTVFASAQIAGNLVNA